MKLPAELKNVYSQNGEDSLLDELYKQISFNISKVSYKMDNTLIEFGVWDGFLFSNTAHLIRKYNLRGILIESNKDRYAELLLNYSSEKHILINKFIELQGSNSIESICNPYLKSLNPLMISIDIDGMDYWVFESMKLLLPVIVVIEYNPTIPLEVYYVNPKNFAARKGSSARAIYELALEKNYSLVAITETNMIFLENEIYKSIYGNKVADLVSVSREFGISIPSNLIFCGYDGKLISTSDVSIPWHGLIVEKNNVKSLPKIFQKFQEDYGIVRRCLFAIYYKIFLISRFGLKLSVKKALNKFRIKFKLF